MRDICLILHTIFQGIKSRFVQINLPLGFPKAANHQVVNMADFSDLL